MITDDDIILTVNYVKKWYKEYGLAQKSFWKTNLKKEKERILFERDQVLLSIDDFYSWYKSALKSCIKCGISFERKIDYDRHACIADRIGSRHYQGDAYGNRIEEESVDEVLWPEPEESINEAP
jgi:hypothetical protein